MNAETQQTWVWCFNSQCVVVVFETLSREEKKEKASGLRFISNCDKWMISDKEAVINGKEGGA
jgi:hypothetical protein